MVVSQSVSVCLRSQTGVRRGSASPPTSSQEVGVDPTIKTLPKDRIRIVVAYMSKAGLFFFVSSMPICWPSRLRYDGPVTHCEGTLYVDRRPPSQHPDL